MSWLGTRNVLRPAIRPRLRRNRATTSWAVTLPFILATKLVVWHAYTGGEEQALEQVVQKWNQAQRHAIVHGELDVTARRQWIAELKSAIDRPASR